MSQHIKDLKEIIFKSQYQTHHIFKKGDLLLMDQLALRLLIGNMIKEI